MKKLIEFKKWVGTILIFIFLALGSNVLAQVVTITGKVTDAATNAPLPGATIQEKGTTNGVTVGVDGTYSIKVQRGATLVCSYIGYDAQELPVGVSIIIDIAMKQSVKALQEVLVTGYGVEKKVDLTGAIGVVNIPQISDVPKTDAMQALQGRVPGLYIEQTGKPSGEAGTILIRGLTTLGNNSPLFIIDGVPASMNTEWSGSGDASGSYVKNVNPLQNIDPNSILSIQVLKDASAASIYGSRASNGVIIITTKEGEGKLKIDFSSSVTMEKRWNVVPVCNTLQHGSALWQAAINDGTDPSTFSAQFLYNYTGTGATAKLISVTPSVKWVGGDSTNRELFQVPGTNWQHVGYQTGFLTKTDLTISGGTNVSSALLGIGYVYNQGVKKYSDYDRINLRLNTSHKLFKNILKVGENMSFGKATDTPEPHDLGGSGMDYLILYENPFMPVYRTDGGWAGPLGSGMSDRNNPLHMLYIHKDNKDNDYTLFGNAYAELTPIKNLTIRSSFGLELAYSRNWWIEQSYTEGFLNATINSLTDFNSLRTDWTWSNTANYNLVLNQHSLNFLVGIEAIKNRYSWDWAEKQGYALQNFNYFQLDAGTGTATNGGNLTGNQLLSYFGKVNYNYAEKYLASATLRYDGSSRFGTNNLFGFYPAFTLGWRLSNEEFLKSIQAISEFKLRVGIGRVGNQKIGDNARFGLYATNYGSMDPTFFTPWKQTGTAYDINGVNSGTLPSGFVATQIENESLKWETNDELNIGADFAFLDYKINGSFDYFIRKSTDILIQPPYPGVLGEGGSEWYNGATLKNHGFEVVLGYKNKIDGFTYSINGTLSSFMDKIISLPESVVSAYPGNAVQTILGHSQSAIFGYVTDGIFQTQEEVNAAPNQPGAAVGRIRYKDLNGDGKIDAYDQTWLGTTLPKFEYGISLDLSYKSFTFSMFINGVADKKLYDGMKWNQTRVYPSMNFGTHVFDAWTPANAGSNLPALSLIDSNNEARSSDYLYVNASYAKVRNMQLSYDLPERITSKLHIRKLQLYLLGENFLVLKANNKGLNKMYSPDPENPYENYPLTKNYTFGVNLSF